MSMPLVQPPPPPLGTIIQQPFHAHSVHGSVGPVIAVLVVIIVLGILAIVVGRLCSGRRIMGYGHYDIENWAETKCSSCIDGRLSPPPPIQPRPDASVTSGSPVRTQEETKPEEQPTQQHSPENHDS